jgi:hypothetical protein
MVELRDGSAWRIWPGDIPKTLQWLPTTEIDVADIEDEICSHGLVDRSNGSRVRVISASAHWPAFAPRGLSSRHAASGEWMFQVRLRLPPTARSWQRPLLPRTSCLGAAAPSVATQLRCALVRAN